MPGASPAEDRLLHALPIFHTHGLFVATNITLMAGGSLIFLPRFDLADMMRLLPKATAMMGVPTFYTRLLSRPDFDPRAGGAHAPVRLRLGAAARPRRTRSSAPGPATPSSSATA